MGLEYYVKVCLWLHEHVFGIVLEAQTIKAANNSRKRRTRVCVCLCEEAHAVGIVVATGSVQDVT